MFDVMKLCAQTLLRHIECTSQIISQITHLRRVREPVRDLPKQSGLPSSYHSILTAATNHAAQTLHRALRREQNLLIKMGRWVARDAHMLYIFNSHICGAQTILHSLYWKAR